jgi:molybdenum cofactor cytidylyltransferase
LVEINQKKVIQRLQETVISSNVDELVVVLGAHVNEIKPYLLNHTKVKFVYNKDHIFGQTSSFITGLRKISGSAQGLMLLPVDYPWVRTDTLDQLCICFGRDPRRILIPVYKGRRGHPPVFPVSLKERFLKLDFSEGINSVWRERGEELDLLDVSDPGVVTTFNTRDELDRFIREPPADQ